MSRKVEMVAEPLISPRKLTARAVGELDVKEYEMEKLHASRNASHWKKR